MVRIALGQINTTVGDLEGNVDIMSAWAGRATDAGADLICFPELAITGYPPEDLVLRRTFVDDNLEALEELARQAAGGCAVLTGFVDRSDAGIHNAAALLDRKGDSTEAIRHFTIALRLNPRHTNARRGLDDLTGRARRSEPAVK